jgi:hypothetical protein
VFETKKIKIKINNPLNSMITYKEVKETRNGNPENNPIIVINLNS